MTRSNVAFVPTGDTLWSGLGPLGFLLWHLDGQKVATFVLRTTCPLNAGDVLPGQPLPPGASASRLDSLPFAPRDFAPFRSGADIAFVGTIVRHGAANRVVPCHIAIADMRRELHIVFDPSGRCSMLDGVRDPSGFPLDPGPRPMTNPFIENIAFSADEIDSFRGSFFNAATIHGNTMFSLEGFFDEPLDFKIGFEPRLVLAHLDTAVELAMAADDVVIDFDRQTMTMRWTSFLVWPVTPSTLERIEVFVLPPDKQERGATRALRTNVARATFAHVHRLAHARKGIAPEPLTDDEVMLERLSAWADLGAASTLDTRTIARIAAELAHGGPDARADVLARHELDEVEWAFEERALMEQLALSATPNVDESEMAEDGSFAAPPLALEYGEAFRERLEELGLAVDMSIDEFAKLQARLEFEPPMAVLRDAQLTIGTFQLLEERMAVVMAEDLQLAERFENVLAAEREKFARNEVQP